jgi:hypothetical protein
MEIKQDPAFTRPPKMRTPPERCNNQKFCEYYDDHGHQTEDCIILRKEIEILIRNGKLVKFVATEKISENDTQDSPQQRRIAPPPRRALIEDGRDSKEGREHRGERERRNKEGMNRGDQPNPQNQLIIREIHTVFEGLAGGSASTSARKAHTRSVHIEEVYRIERPFKIQKKDTAVISFLDKDAEGLSMPHDDALVVTTTIAN